MYKINNISLVNFGIVPGRAPNSNIALEGFLDFPKRTGKTYHDWGEEIGVEPYVADTDRFEYDLVEFTFHGYVKSSSREGVVQRMQDLYNYINAQTEVLILSCPWGNYGVYVEEKIELDYMGPYAAKVKIPFKSVFGLEAIVLPGARATGLHHIDNIPLLDFGAYVEKVANNFDRPAIKEQFFAAPNQYQLTKPGYKEFKQTLVFTAQNYDGLYTNVRGFYNAIQPPGTNIMNVDGLERECFNFKGTQVTGIRIMEGLTLCKMTLTMALAFDGVPKEPRYLFDTDDDAIASNSGKLIRTQEPVFLDLADNRGLSIRNNEFEPITLD